MPPVALSFLEDGPRRAAHTLILAHGAGTPMDHPSLAAIALGVAAGGVRVLRFEFPYMAAARGAARRGVAAGARRAPDREPVLLAMWRAAIAEAGVPTERLVIGGRSMGGRIASMVADEAGVAGLVCYDYPFHPPGRPAKVRTAHLKRLRTPAVIFQGERDPFGTRADVEGYALPRAIRVRWMPDGDHGLAPRKSSGLTAQGHLEAVVAETIAFVLTGERPRSGRVASSRAPVTRTPAVRTAAAAWAVGSRRRWRARA